MNEIIIFPFRCAVRNASSRQFNAQHALTGPITNVPISRRVTSNDSTPTITVPPAFWMTKVCLILTNPYPEFTLAFRSTFREL